MRSLCANFVLSFVNIGEGWSFFTSILMMEAEPVSETLVFNSTLTQLMA
jgi:hypothetical protein